MLQLLKNLRSFSHGKEISDSDIINWANYKVKCSGRRSRISSFKVSVYKTFIIFLPYIFFSFCQRIGFDWNMMLYSGQRSF